MAKSRGSTAQVVIKTVYPKGLVTVEKDGSLKVTLLIPPHLAADAYVALHPVQGRAMKIEMWYKHSTLRTWDDVDTPPDDEEEDEVEDE